ncbi:hypothetical protein ABBQ38_004316 [Trebouxia sp. C0009 RCD-2024]
MPNPFWKGAATVMLHKHNFTPPLAPPTDKQTPAANSGWASAAQRHRETPSPTAAAATFRPSGYLPAEQVCAEAPKAPEKLTVLVKRQRPRRPKVEVSPGLKLLLQSTAELQQQQQQQQQKLALVPSQQPAVSLPLSQQNAGVTPPGQVVLKKRPQYATSAPAAPRLAQMQSGAHAAAGQATGTTQLPGSAAVTNTMPGSKRPAVPAGMSVVPALLKRPKLGAHTKPPVSKAGASQARGTAAAAAAKAAGKAATVKKASAVPKASTKVPAAASVPTSSTIQPSGQGMAAADAHAAQASLTGTAAVSAAAAKTVGTSAAQAAAVAASAEGAPAPAATAAPAKAPRQRKKAEDIDLAEVEKKIREKQAAGRLQDISIPELKCFLKARKLPVGGKKAELLARAEPMLATA